MFSDILFQDLKDYADKSSLSYKEPLQYTTRKIRTRHFMVKRSNQVVGIISESDMCVMMSITLANAYKSFYVTLYKQNTTGEMIFAGYSVRSEHCDELFRAELV